MCYMKPIKIMKKILILLILFLSWAWAYTSWYWYSCNIKKLCWDLDDSFELTTNWEYASFSLSWSYVRDEDSFDIDADTWISPEDDIVSLSANDVTWPSSAVAPQAVVEKQVAIENEWVEEEQEISDRSTPSPTPESEPTSVARNICQNPLEWPISLWGNNDADEVLALERFLIGRGILISSDGIFWDDDFEAIKVLQEEFRSEILTPWGINNPTGYVGRTTIQKIQELSCR